MVSLSTCFHFLLATPVVQPVNTTCRAALLNKLLIRVLAQAFQRTGKLCGLIEEDSESSSEEELVEDFDSSREPTHRSFDNVSPLARYIIHLIYLDRSCNLDRSNL